MAPWRNAKASLKLAEEVNGRWPSRDRSSDGTIGDAAHASRQSDHNPWVKDANGVGVVRARDIDEDLDGNPANGVDDAGVLFRHLLGLARAGDRRFANGGYLIYEGQIWSEKNNWQGRPYTGLNAHKQHIHVSLSRDAAGYDSTASWGIWDGTRPQPEAPTQPTSTQEDIFMALSDDQQRELLNKVYGIELYLAVLTKVILDEPDAIRPNLLARIRDGVARLEAAK